MIKRIIWWIVTILSIAGIVTFCVVSDKYKFKGYGEEVSVTLDGNHEGYYMGLFGSYGVRSLYPTKYKCEALENQPYEYANQQAYLIYYESIEDNEFYTVIESDSKYFGWGLIIYDSINDEFIHVSYGKGRPYCAPMHIEFTTENMDRVAVASRTYPTSRAVRFILLCVLLSTLLEMVVALIYRFNNRKLFFILGISALNRALLIIPFYFIEKTYGSGPMVCIIGTLVLIILDAFIYLFFNKKIEGSDPNIEVSNRFGLTKKKVAINITFSIVKNLVALLALIVVLM